jgi:acetate kinase
VRPILVVNSGSSSVKYQLIDIDESKALASGLIERVSNHADAFARMLGELEGAEPVAVGHRVVHGGSKFSQPAIIDTSVLNEIESLSSLAPLHNPGNVAGIRAALDAYPDIPHLAVFDTAFHQTMPPSSYRYAIDAALESEHKIRRYGFHGSSHSFVARKAAEFIGKPANEFSGIILHIGNGASACAVKNGKSFDTSMGFTPLQGLVMGSRSGDIDVAVVAHLHRVAGLSIDEIDESLNKNGGLKGMTGDGDLRDVQARALAGDQIAIDALAVYAQRVKHYIGAYLAEIGPIEALVFTAGVGENSASMRAQIVDGLEHLGLVLDSALNEAKSSDARNLAAGSVPILVIPTNEELEIALQTEAFI